MLSKYIQKVVYMFDELLPSVPLFAINLKEKSKYVNFRANFRHFCKFLKNPACDATRINFQVRHVLGFGFGLMFIPGVVASSQHFVQRRDRSATALIISSQLLVIVFVILPNLPLFKNCH
jgi:hypothetical protein